MYRPIEFPSQEDVISEACKNGHLDILRSLRWQGWDFKKESTKSRDYPFHHAIKYKQEAVAIWLIREDLVEDSQVTYPGVLQPIHWSCQDLLFKVTNELLKNGASPNSFSFRHYSPLSFAFEHRPDPDRNDLTEDERLRIARFALLLFAYGANPSLSDCYGKKPIQSFVITEDKDVTPYFKNAFKATAESTEKLPLFPLDIWKKILRSIWGEDLFVALRVCRTWHKYITQKLSENFIKEEVWVN